MQFVTWTKLLIENSKFCVNCEWTDTNYRSIIKLFLGRYKKRETYGGMLELEYKTVLKTVAKRIGGSNPLTSTTRLFSVNLLFVVYRVAVNA